ncbi:8-oxo-dGTP diphosphatase [Metarhizium acridum]|nr:8-oxo-dGTP diphosphatase [Metarhizium acridum]
MLPPSTPLVSTNDQRHLLADLVGAFEESLYYDASTMAGLNSFSLLLSTALRAYKPPPFPLWDTLPARKRAAVLVLLYADRWGDLRVRHHHAGREPEELLGPCGAPGRQG